MATFLRINGYDVTASQRERAMWMIELSEGLTVAELAERIRATLTAR